MEKIKDAIAKAKSQRSTSQPGGFSPQKIHVDIVKPDELEELTYATTVTAKLDQAVLEKHRIVAFNKNERASWAFDLLRTQVLQKMEENDWRTLAVISPTPGAGKTVVAINLAISIAQQPHKTAMVVDFDLRRPKLAQYLGLSMKKSLNEYLDGQAALSEIMVNPEIPRLVALQTNRPVARSSEMLSSPKIASLIRELRDRYDSRIVIFDLPPILSADDAIAVLPNMDCVLMVVGNGMSKPAEIEEAIHHLQGTNLLGVVLNKAEVEPRTYHY